MIIESIRLRNIKSYGEGPDGKGVVIRFEKGVNRVAGRNGHGKSTLIESLGYALFLTEPQFEENFQIEKYFLSHGAKEGEIEVAFSADGERYAIERPIGKQSKKRAKVIQLSDNSICAEDQHVQGFLCRLLKFPDANQLSEIFCKLVGVKQGRLTWPFDSKPSEAKRYFEPLFDVEVFRQCFDKLKGAVDVFEEQGIEHNNTLAGIEVMIRDREDSAEKLRQAREAATTGEGELKNAEKALEVARKAKEQLEKAQQALQTAENAVATATHKQQHAFERRALAAKDVEAAKAAAEVVQQNKPAHEAFVAAEATLHKLNERREQRDNIRGSRELADREATQKEGAAQTARASAKESEGLRDAKRQAAEELSAAMATAKAVFDSSATTFTKSAQDAESAQQHCEAVNRWVRNLDGALARQQSTAMKVADLSSAIAAWDAKTFTALEQAEKEASEKVAAIERRHAAAQNERATLEAQLKQIEGGVCPFLKETCRQFDATKIKGDLEQHTKLLQQIASELAVAKAAQEQAIAAANAARAEQNKFNIKRTQLADCLNAYRDGCSDLKIDGIASALNWLHGWELSVGKSPALPSQPAEVDAGSVAMLHSQLHTGVGCVQSWWQHAHQKIKSQLTQFKELERTRIEQQRSLVEQNKQLVELRREVEMLTAKVAAKTTDAAKQEAAAKTLREKITHLDEQLKPFANIDAELKVEQQKRDSHRAGHEKFLGAKALADELSTKTNRLSECETDEKTAVQAVQQATSVLADAKKNFDPEKLKEAQEQHAAKNRSFIELRVRLTEAHKTVKNEEQRFDEWKKACDAREVTKAAIDRCDAAVEITELARKTLRDTAPAVAQHLCSRIAASAQRVFNVISPEPIELAWEANNYSLRISPGERRFAMLSGGEQTKLALAITLAMIEEFSGLRFCIFDEPTYGVDADSRPKLADAILQACEAASLDQLLLVSHDDAFEDKIEHAILLEKSATHGTAVVAAS